MDIEEARKLLFDEGFILIKLIEEYDDASVFLCRRKNGTEIEVAIQNGLVIIAPT